MDVVGRAQAVILRPREEWPKIKTEPTRGGDLFTSYAMILAAIPAAAEFIRLVLIGQKLPVVGLTRWSVGRALISAVVAYAFSLATVYLFAFVINAVAPSFSSTQSMTNALKLAVYSMTPAWVAGILNIIPHTGWLVVLASLYALYVLYCGLDASIMDTPRDRVPGYMGTSVVVVIVLYLVFEVMLKAIVAIRFHA